MLGGFSVGARTLGQNEWQLRGAAALIKLLALAPNHRLHREQISRSNLHPTNRPASPSFPVARKSTAVGAPHVPPQAINRITYQPSAVPWDARVGRGDLESRLRCVRRALGVLHGFVEFLQALLGVGEEHHGFLGVVEEGVVDAGEAWAE
jgi:hypothetical protein